MTGARMLIRGKLTLARLTLAVTLLLAVGARLPSARSKLGTEVFGRLLRLVLVGVFAVLVTTFVGSVLASNGVAAATTVPAGSSFTTAHAYDQTAELLRWNAVVALGFSAAEDAAGGLAPIAGGAEITADDLTGSAAANYGRFLKSLPASAEEPTITGLPGGGFKFEADVPASNIPGSYATYTKEIDGDGVTTTFYKTTYAPDGSVVSVKVKYP